MNEQEYTHLSAIIDDSPFGELMHDAIGHSLNGDAPIIYSASDLKRRDKKLFINLANIMKYSLISQNQRWEKAKKYPAHMVNGHGSETSNFALLLSTLGMEEIGGRDVREGFIASAAGLMHDLGKGEKDEYGEDIHAKESAGYAKDVILPALDDIEGVDKDQIVSLIEGHEDVRDYLLGAGLRERVRGYLGFEKRKDPRFLISLADTRGRAEPWREYIVWYSVMEEKGMSPEEFMRGKWFYYHGEDDSIYEPVEWDRRPQILKRFDEDIRKTLERFRRRLKVGEHAVMAPVDRATNFVYRANSVHGNITPESLENSYDFHSRRMSKYLKNVNELYDI